MHCLNHHIYTNTLLDYEITAFYPLVNYLRVLPPNWPYIQIVFEPILILLPLLNLLLKIVVVPLTKFSPPNLLYFLTLTPIILLYIINGDMYTSIYLFVVMQMSFGFFFAKSVFCGHRVPDLWTEGEAEVADFGLHTVMSSADTDQKSTGYHSLLIYTGFNIHVAHHFFPTIDHEHLWKVQEILEEVCRKRGIKLFSNSMIECNKKISKLYHTRQVFKPPIYE
jgi:fatty acid desaturase